MRILATPPSVSTAIFVMRGTWLIGLGKYLMLFRAALLPEDARYIGTTLSGIHSAAPGLDRWLHRVFTVMGGFIVAAGVLTIFVAKAAPMTREPLRWTVLALAGLMTVATMSIQNFS